MSIGIRVNPIEGEEVARQANRNREWTQIDANSWEQEYARLLASMGGYAPVLDISGSAYASR
jgi:hypothetical protein